MKTSSGSVQQSIGHTGLKIEEAAYIIKPISLALMDHARGLFDIAYKVTGRMQHQPPMKPVACVEQQEIVFGGPSSWFDLHTIWAVSCPD